MSTYDNENEWHEAWEGDQHDTPGDIEFLDRFIESDVYKDMCMEADVRQDPDSIALLDKIMMYLDSIMWHIKHDSPKSRVDYELKEFKLLVQDFLEEI